MVEHFQCSSQKKKLRFDRSNVSDMYPIHIQKLSNCTVSVGTQVHEQD